MAKTRITRIGWIALVVSFIGASGVFVFSWMLLYSDTLGDGGWTKLGPGVYFAALFSALIGLPASIVLDIIAGFHGFRNRIAGLVGGVLLLVPIPLVFLIAVRAT